MLWLSDLRFLSSIDDRTLSACKPDVLVHVSRCRKATSDRSVIDPACRLRYPLDGGSVKGR
jgi:hypothetical protein